MHIDGGGGRRLRGRVCVRVRVRVRVHAPQRAVLRQWFFKVADNIANCVKPVQRRPVSQQDAVAVKAVPSLAFEATSRNG